MLNENIKKYRKEKGISQEELADKIHVVRQTVSKWEKGYSVPDSDLLQKIAIELNVTVSDLLSTCNENNTEETSDISKQLEIINNALSKEVTKRKTILKVCTIAAFLVVAVLLFLKITYFNPYVAYLIAKPVDVETDDTVGSKSGRYCEWVSLAYSTKMGFPLSKDTKELLDDFSQKNNEVIYDLRNNYDAPMHIEVSVITDNNSTRFTYSGTVTKNGQETEYLNYFFVMKKLKSSS